MAAIAALNGPWDCVRATVAAYQRRRDVLVEGLNAAGWAMEKPHATMFVWAGLPKGYTDSKTFVIALMERTGVVVVPGDSFGPAGAGCVRMALVQDEERMAEVVRRLAASGMLGNG